MPYGEIFGMFSFSDKTNPCSLIAPSAGLCCIKSKREFTHLCFKSGGGLRIRFDVSYPDPGTPGGAGTYCTCTPGGSLSCYFSENSRLCVEKEKCHGCVDHTSNFWAWEIILGCEKTTLFLLIKLPHPSFKSPYDCASPTLNPKPLTLNPKP